MPKPDTFKPDTYVDQLYEVVKLGESSKKVGSPTHKTYLGSPSRSSLSSNISPITEKALSGSTGISPAAEKASLTSPSGVVTLRSSRSLSPRASPRAFISSYSSDDLLDVKSYLNKRQTRDELRGLFRLSKAMKWYLFYVSVVCGFLYLYFVHPRIIYTIIDMNTIFVIFILVLNYGLTGVSFLLSTWPAPKNSGPQVADGDTVLATFERVLTIVHFALFLAQLFTNPISTEIALDQFITKATLNIPHIATAILGFPRRVDAHGKPRSSFVQTLVFLLRVVAQFGSTLALLLCIQMFGGSDVYIISIFLPLIPFSVFMFFYVRARMFNKILPTSKTHAFIMFGDRPIREVMLFVVVLCFTFWMACFMAIQLFFAFSPAGPATAALMRATSYDVGSLNVLTFVWLCSVVALMVYGIPSLYHSLLDYPNKIPPVKKFRLGGKGTCKHVLAFCNCCYLDDKESAEYVQPNGPQAVTMGDTNGNGGSGGAGGNAANGSTDKNNGGADKNNGSTDEDNGDDNILDVDKRSNSLKDNNRLHFMYDISLVIACHLSENNIKPTLDAAISANFPNTNIFVAHNGGSLAPPDKTGSVVRNTPAYNGVHYVYLPEGNKTIAMNWVIQHCVKTPLVMIIDDDVMLPHNVDLEGAYHELQTKPEMKAIAFTIRGVDNPNLWQVFQHIEYLQAGFNKIFQAQFGSVLTCHGAIALWRTDTVKEVFQEHNTEFNGEDLQMGLILRRMNKNFTIGVNAVEPVPTTAPKSLFYEKTKNEKSLFVQRIFSWDMAAHHFIGDFLEIMFLNWERNSIILKPFLVLELWTQFQDWMRFIFIITLIQKDLYYTMFILVVLQLIQLCLVVVFDRVILSNRPDVQTAFWILVLYPLYNVIIIFFRFGGLLVNLMYYTPWNPPRINISDREDRGELPPKILLEYEVSRELQEYYWNNIWKSPAETYKRVAAKVKRGTVTKPNATQHIHHHQMEHQQKMIDSAPATAPVQYQQVPNMPASAALPPMAATPQQPGQPAPQVQQLTTILQQQLQLQQLTHLLQLQLQQQLRPPQPQLPQGPATTRPRSSSFAHYRTGRTGLDLSGDFSKEKTASKTQLGSSFNKDKTASSTKLASSKLDNQEESWLKGLVERRNVRL